jgi:hypothetical protein
VGSDPRVSLRLLYLIFWQVLGLVLLMGRPSSTTDVELLVLRLRPRESPGVNAATQPESAAEEAEASAPHHISKDVAIVEDCGSSRCG